jgi:F-type H+-transporting ATPase subunit delta
VANSASLVSVVANRYAGSIFDLAVESDSLDKVEADLSTFDGMLRDNGDLMRLVRSPVFSADDQRRAIDVILSRTGIGGLVANLVRLMARNRRLFAVPGVLGRFRDLLAAHRGEVSAKVTVARALTDAQSADLKKALDAVAGKQVAIDATVDPGILGGMIVRIGSRQIDTSIRTKLSSLKLALKEVG